MALVMIAKIPIPGSVKTRLVGELTPEQAAGVYEAMLDCTIQRMNRIFRDNPCFHRILAVNSSSHSFTFAANWQWVEQGSGDLGERIARIWGAIGGGPAAFFGADCPDVPDTLIESVPAALMDADVAMGPVADGGYWTIAGRQLQPSLLNDIDWGTDRVYHQSLAAAQKADLTVARLPQWYDVDRPDDVKALCSRIQQSTDTTLISLGKQLDTICQGSLTMNFQEPVSDLASPSPQLDIPNSKPSDPTDPRPQNSVSAETQTDRVVEIDGSIILLVDDNAQNLELLQAYLETLSCTILMAEDGIEAMKIIDERRQSSSKRMPDLILLDIMMPRMSGFEVCRRLKDDPATRSIPVMMVTALNELGDIERGVNSGTDDFVTKPVNKLELITRVKSLLRVRHLKRELDRTMAYIQSIEQGGR